MARPALMVVYEDRGVLAALDQALRTRFGADYQILAAAAPAAALDTLRRLRQAGEQVALVVADQWLQGMTGVELLCQAHALHPTAKRVLLITYGDAAGGTAGPQTMALGQLDLHLNAPWGPPELQLYPAISEALSQWAKSTSSLGPSPELVRIVGPRWSPRSHEFRDLLARNSISHGFYDADSQDGRRLLAQAGVEAAGSPVLLLFDGRVLVDPPTGETPSGYLRRIRIEAAKQLLETTADPVDHLRARVGYGDPTAFRRAFTQATGLGPRQYRQKYGPRPRDT